MPAPRPTLPGAWQPNYPQHFESGIEGWQDEAFEAAPSRKRPRLDGGAEEGRTAEVRFESAESAEYARQEADSSWIEDCQINVTPVDAGEGSKLLVRGLPWNFNWRSIKEHFQQWGPVAHVQVWGAHRQEDGAPVEGEVRFEDPSKAIEALLLNGSLMGGKRITVELDPGSKDQAKIKITGLPPRTKWQELKDHFVSVGAIKFAGIKGVNGVSGRVGPPTMNQFHQQQMMAMLAAAVGQQQQQAASEAVAAQQHDGRTAEVRFEEPANGVKALRLLHGQLCGDQPMLLQLDTNVGDGGTLLVHVYDANVTLMQIGALFETSIGTVASCQIRTDVATPPLPGSEPAPCVTPPVDPQMLQQAAQMLLQSQQALQVPQGPPGEGEVRFEGPESAAVVKVAMAIEHFNGRQFKGHTLSVAPDSASKDGSKIIVTNVPPFTRWQELKDMFSACGTVAYARVHPAGHRQQQHHHHHHR